MPLLPKLPRDAPLWDSMCLGVGTVVIVIGIAALIGSLWFSASAQRAEGIVVAGRGPVSCPGPCVRARVETPTGDRILAVSVPSDTTLPEPGAVIAIAYDPNHPDRAALYDFWRAWFWPAAVGLLFLMLGGGAIMAWRSQIRDGVLGLASQTKNESEPGEGPA